MYVITDTIILVDEMGIEVNIKLELYAQILGSLGFRLSRSKAEYISINLVKKDPKLKCWDIGQSSNTTE